jgi:hypothetical protein
MTSEIASGPAPANPPHNRRSSFRCIYRLQRGGDLIRAPRDHKTGAADWPTQTRLCKPNLDPQRCGQEVIDSARHAELSERIYCGASLGPFAP